MAALAFLFCQTPLKHITTAKGEFVVCKQERQPCPFFTKPEQLKDYCQVLLRKVLKLYKDAPPLRKSHRKPCRMYLSRTDKNFNRPFFKCRLHEDPCDTLHWADENPSFKTVKANQMRPHPSLAPPVDLDNTIWQVEDGQWVAAKDPAPVANQQKKKENLPSSTNTSRPKKPASSTPTSTPPLDPLPLDPLSANAMLAHFLFPRTNLVPRALVTLVQRNGKTNGSGIKRFLITGFLLFRSHCAGVSV